MDLKGSTQSFSKASLAIWHSHRFSKISNKLYDCLFKLNTALKVVVFGVILVRIFLYLDWIRRNTSHLSVFCLNAGQSGSEKLRIWTLFTEQSIFKKPRSTVISSSQWNVFIVSTFWVIRERWRWLIRCSTFGSYPIIRIEHFLLTL